MEWAREHVRPFEEAGAYLERSPSGTGLHAIGKGKLPIEGSGIKVGGFGLDGSGAIEMYQHSRYFTMTGETFP